jgi:septum formation protein
VDPLDKAGAYAIQTNPDMIIERWEGSLSNVIGLPVERLRKELKHLKLGKLDLFLDLEKLALQLDELY